MRNLRVAANKESLPLIIEGIYHFILDKSLMILSVSNVMLECRNLKLFCVYLLIVFVSSGIIYETGVYAQYGTFIDDDIISDTTWDKNGSPYTIVSNIAINEGVTLTVQPGVIIRIVDDVQLVVNGIFNSVGTNNDLVTISGQGEKRNWSFALGGNGQIIQKYNLIEESFLIKDTVYVSTYGVSIENCIIKGALVFDLGNYIDVVLSNLQVENIEFTKIVSDSNLSFNSVISESVIIPTLWGSTVTFDGGEINLIKFNQVDQKGSLNTPTITSEIGFVSGSYDFINIESILENSKIYFNNVKVKKFNVKLSPLNEINNCEITFFNSIIDNINIEADYFYDSLLRLSWVTCNELNIDAKIASSVLHLSDCSFSFGSGIYLASFRDSEITLFDNKIFGNKPSGLTIDNGDSKINAQNNWWGSPEGPYHEIINPTSKGDKISSDPNYVEFIPWLTTPGENTEPPKAVIKTEKNVYEVNEEILFDAGASNDDGEILYWSFTFGDGERTSWINKSTIVHSYSSPGEYQASVLIVDQDGRLSCCLKSTGCR